MACPPLLPTNPYTHISPDPLVDRVHEEGGEETAKIHHQWDGGNELLLGQNGHGRVRWASLGSGAIPQPWPPPQLTLGRLRE